MPMVNAVVATGITFAFDIEKDDAFLLALLSASVSHSCRNCNIRLSVSEANTGLYLPLSLAVTFPFNISLGIPLYYYFITIVWGG